MKIRESFVSNSSSTSFIITAKNHNATQEELDNDYNKIINSLSDPYMGNEYLEHTREIREKLEKLHNDGYYIGQLITSNWADQDDIESMLDQLERLGVKRVYREDY